MLVCALWCVESHSVSNCHLTGAGSVWRPLSITSLDWVFQRLLCRGRFLGAGSSAAAAAAGAGWAAATAAAVGALLLLLRRWLVCCCCCCWRWVVCCCCCCSGSAASAAAAPLWFAAAAWWQTADAWCAAAAWWSRSPRAGGRRTPGGGVHKIDLINYLRDLIKRKSN